MYGKFHPFTGNGNTEYCFEIALNKLNLFLAGFSHLKPLCGRGSSRNLFIGPKRRLSNWFCRGSSKFCSWLTTMCKVQKSPQVAPPPHIWISNPEISVKMKRENWKPLAKVQNYQYWGILKIIFIIGHSR